MSGSGGGFELKSLRLVFLVSGFQKKVPSKVSASSS